MLNDIDSKFTVLNKWIKAQPSTENARTLRTVATIGAAYTAFDTIDRNKDYKVDVKTEILANGQAIEATVTVDSRVLASYSSAIRRRMTYYRRIRQPSCAVR